MAQRRRNARSMVRLQSTKSISAPGGVPEDAKSLPHLPRNGRLLAEHVQQLGFTHVEFLPVMEHPFYGSGLSNHRLLRPTSRFGAPQDLMFLIDYLHRQGIGVILDWVPSHFPTDEHGLGFFDGTHLFELRQPAAGIPSDWKSFIFNYAARRSAASSSVERSLVDKYHADGLRRRGRINALPRLFAEEANGCQIPTAVAKT